MSQQEEEIEDWRLVSIKVRLLQAGDKGRMRGRSASSARLRKKPITLAPVKFLESVEE